MNWFDYLKDLQDSMNISKLILKYYEDEYYFEFTLKNNYDTIIYQHTVNGKKLHLISINDSKLGYISPPFNEDISYMLNKF